MTKLFYIVIIIVAQLHRSIALTDLANRIVKTMNDVRDCVNRYAHTADFPHAVRDPVYETPPETYGTEVDQMIDDDRAGLELLLAALTGPCQCGDECATHECRVKYEALVKRIQTIDTVGIITAVGANITDMSTGPTGSGKPDAHKAKTTTGVEANKMLSAMRNCHNNRADGQVDPIYSWPTIELAVCNIDNLENDEQAAPIRVLDSMGLLGCDMYPNCANVQCESAYHDVVYYGYSVPSLYDCTGEPPPIKQ